ncbi:polysaccharide deacetylase [Mucilaginibacter terrenus]|uniref:Polysaccharide deacetylase n=1 Tax=Mucilaginibacter terrenus TaxID=2482727 RepID=A0A3E2NW33_9SPHI|nr:polysaccharide deacetylase family protein [Mucilaginibacter terrenus]RFZ85223.1 polysaccharide deacetylase [Mucilaginibacter terrenus]
MSTRKEFLKNASLLGAGAMFIPKTLFSEPTDKSVITREPTGWSDGTRLIISISMQFEAGGEPEFGFDSPFPANLKTGFPDLPAKTWFTYGYKEGISRMLDLWDKHNIKVTSHVIGGAAQKSPDLTREIAKRGHEISGHGLYWTPEYAMSYEEEKKFIKDSVDLIKNITGQTTTGYNCNWLRRSKNTIKILQELGFTYHIDDLSRDEPFLIPVEGKKFVVVPYTLRCNDILLLEGRNFSSTQFLETLKLEFDQLYKEGATKKRMMSFSAHDRISGTPAQVNVMDQFLKYALQHEGVKVMRKDDIAKLTMNDKTSLIDPDYH